MSSQTQKNVLLMLRQARAKPRNTNITKVCGPPAPVSSQAALPMLYELEHGPAPTAAPAATTLPVRPAATKATATATKATATKANATKANASTTNTSTTRTTTTTNATKATVTKSATKTTAGAGNGTNTTASR
ncbi:hypothetical protein F5144DRAFT_599916 [Chaetomium tenue]|uniref:Uncharacterized protein n=1 Tax=Chaetomium tenue TaxID=1854479 RepID=A0ACB7PHJ1_9PEZI|nr:hypothetical protein F5144DRAFT_599916 [Chaetomium globosum]